MHLLSELERVSDEYYQGNLCIERDRNLDGQTMWKVALASAFSVSYDDTEAFSTIDEAMQAALDKHQKELKPRVEHVRCAWKDCDAMVPISDLTEVSLLVNDSWSVDGHGGGGSYSTSGFLCPHHASRLSAQIEDGPTSIAAEDHQ
jgi:hypothetical protein